MLEAKIPVQSRRVMLLDDEPRCVGRLSSSRLRPTCRLGRLLEIALALVLIEFLGRHCRIDSAQIPAYASPVGLGTPWKAAVLLAVGAAGGASAVAIASVPDGNVIHACYEVTAAGSTVPSQSLGNVRIVDSTQTCDTAGLPSGGGYEHGLTWNVTGPQGPPGLNGTNGSPGAPGAPGKSVTIAGGNTLTLAGGQVVHLGTSPGLSINPPAPGKTAIATLTLDAGRATITTAVLGFSLVHPQTATGSGAARRVSVQEIQITKRVDKASPKLFQACATGKHFPKATLVLSKAGHSTIYNLTNVAIAAAQTGSTKGSSQPVETLTLNFTKIAFKY